MLQFDVSVLGKNVHIMDSNEACVMRGEGWSYAE